MWDGEKSRFGIVWRERVHRILWLPAASYPPFAKSAKDGAPTSLVTSAKPKAGPPVQVTSKTLWNEGSGRIDVENPNPGQRPGQIHYQDGTGKYIYDVGKREFKGLSATKNEQLLSRPEVQQAIQKGLKYLGAAQ